MCVIPLSGEYKRGREDAISLHEKDTLQSAYIAVRELTFRPSDEHKYASGYIAGCAKYEREEFKKSRCDKMISATGFISERMNK